MRTFFQKRWPKLFGEADRSSLIERSAPIAGIRFLVIDAETTGFRVGFDRILSLAVAEVKAGRLELASLRDWIVYRKDAALNQATAVHGILPSRSASGSPEKEVLEALLPLIDGAIIVGHHIRFDMAMLDEAYRRHCGVKLRNRFVDTAIMATRGIEAFQKTGYSNQRPPTLEEVCAYCGWPMMERHTAAGDVMTTAQLFLLCCAKEASRLRRPLMLRDLPLDRL